MTDFQFWKLLRYKWICLNSYCYPEFLNALSHERMLLTSGIIERFHNLPLLLTKRSIEMKTCEFHSTALVFLRQVELRHQYTHGTDCVAHHCNFMAWKVSAIFIWMILLLLINYHHINADIGWEKNLNWSLPSVMTPVAKVVQHNRATTQVIHKLSLQTKNCVHEINFTILQTNYNYLTPLSSSFYTAKTTSRKGNSEQ